MAHDSPRILFRADASAQIGTGHVVRCLTLARVLVSRGWEGSIVGRMSPDLAETIREAGVGAHEVPDGLPLKADAPHLVKTGVLDGVDVVVSDHYDLAADWQRAVRGGARLMAAIDDLAARPQAVDLLLNQNLGATPGRYRGLVPEGAIVLAGPSYALLRPEFAEARAQLRERPGNLRRILVFLSGADEHEVTGRAASAAAAVAGAEVDVVVGSAYPSIARLQSWAAARRNVHVHVNTAQMSALMAGADLAIGAPSSASWERCTLALPSILVILADNQVEVAGLLDRAGAAQVLGWHHDVSTDRMTDAIVGLGADADRLRAMGRAAAAITDGSGAIRVADALEALVADHARTNPATGAAS
jgi:UDP-2,4-diacetamido-2,4,6-trideoxy-beta-L-altropyranose hydrolase